MPLPLSRQVKFALVALSLAVIVAGCGRRGPLEAPIGGRDIPGEDNAQRETPTTAGAIGNPIGQPSQGRREPIKPPPGPFVLDFLL
ncbi:lipoprotein [Terrarubrum flagellatum]|uniref:LptM family lipoprotein n=1 Tax=Terrirubrum flagellatum TaxID=2895980 RepID=UPI00314560E6